MKHCILVFAAALLPWTARALDFPVPVNVAPAPAPTTPAPALPVGFKNPSELDALLSPIALYPDALLALILPAVTTTPQIALAVHHVTINGSDEVLAAQPWSESVKALTDFPDVLRWLNTNAVWSQALGLAFTYQPSEVMNSVQRLRLRARATGNLVDTAQQRVILDNGAVVILPALPNNIYVPVYDPTVVYYYSPYQTTRTFISPRATIPKRPWTAGRNIDWRTHQITRPPDETYTPRHWGPERPSHFDRHSPDRGRR
jgi:hypothetical protein